METRSYSTVVIGAGSGGLTVAIGLANLGRSVALVEGHYVGGDCTNVGCIPSKTLIHEVAEGEHADPRATLAFVRQKRDHLRDEETATVQGIDRLDFIQGWAAFRGPRQLEVAREGLGPLLIEAENIVIATGSRPRIMQIPGLPSERTLTNESLFEQQDAPRHLAIVGAGVVAMEMAFAFHKLGSQVSLIARGGLLSSNAPEAGEALLARAHELGLKVYLRAKPTSYDAAGEALALDVAGERVVLEGVDKVLLALGRERNLERLNLAAAGVKWDAREGVAVDSYGQTNVRGIFAIGDVTPTSKFTHSANAQGRRVVQRIAFPLLPARGKEPIYPAAIFSDPEVASVGMSPREIAGRFHPGLVKKIHFELKDTDRGYTEGLRHGFIQVYALRLTGRILGATIVGPRAAEMLSFFTLAISEKISLYRLYRLVYPYPTHSSGIQKVADAFVRETLTNLRGELTAYLRYRLAAAPEAAPQGDGGRQGYLGAQ